MNGGGIVAAEKYTYVYTKRFEAYSRELRKAGEEIKDTAVFKWTPERIKYFMSKGLIRRKYTEKRS